MPDLQDTATVHPETVAKAEEHAEALRRQRDAERKREYRRRRKLTAPSPVQSTKVDPGVWATALRLAGGDATRIERRPPDRYGDVVVVVNHSKRRSTLDEFDTPAREIVNTLRSGVPVTFGTRVTASTIPTFPPNETSGAAPKRRKRKSHPSKHGRGRRENRPPQWWAQFETIEGVTLCPLNGCEWTYAGDKSHLALTTHYRQAHQRRLVDDYPA